MGGKQRGKATVAHEICTYYKFENFSRYSPSEPYLISSLPICCSVSITSPESVHSAPVFYAFRPICCLHFGPVSEEKQRFLPFLRKWRRFEGTKNAKSAPNIGALFWGHFYCKIVSQHPSPNVKTLCNFEPRIWPEIITSREAESTCFKGSRTSCDVITLGIFVPNFGRKRSHHVMDASCR